jgi:hypothetical protein
VQAAFQPEGGAYSGNGHHHDNEHTRHQHER